MLKKAFQCGFLLSSLALGADERVIVRLQGRCEGQGSNVVRWDLERNGRKDRDARRDFRVPAGHRLVVTQAAFTVRGGRTFLKRGGQFTLFKTDRSGRSEMAEVSGTFHPELPSSTVVRRFRPGLVVPAGAAPGVAWQLSPPDRCVLSVTLHGWLVAETAPRAD